MCTCIRELALCEQSGGHYTLGAVLRPRLPSQGVSVALSSISISPPPPISISVIPISEHTILSGTGLPPPRATFLPPPPPLTPLPMAQQATPNEPHTSPASCDANPSKTNTTQGGNAAPLSPCCHAAMLPRCHVAMLPCCCVACSWPGVWLHEECGARHGGRSAGRAQTWRAARHPPPRVGRGGGHCKGGWRQQGPSRGL